MNHEELRRDAATTLAALEAAKRRRDELAEALEAARGELRRAMLAVDATDTRALAKLEPPSLRVQALEAQLEDATERAKEALVPHWQAQRALEAFEAGGVGPWLEAHAGDLGAIREALARAEAAKAEASRLADALEPGDATPAALAEALRNELPAVGFSAVNAAARRRTEEAWAELLDLTRRHTSGAPFDDRHPERQASLLEHSLTHEPSFANHPERERLAARIEQVRRSAPRVTSDRERATVARIGFDDAADFHH